MENGLPSFKIVGGKKYPSWVCNKYITALKQMDWTKEKIAEIQKNKDKDGDLYIFTGIVERQLTAVPFHFASCYMYSVVLTEKEKKAQQ